MGRDFFTFTPGVAKEKGEKEKMECPEFEFMRRVSLFFSRAPIFGVFLFPLPVFCVVGKFRVYSHFPHILGHCQSALCWLLHMWGVFCFPTMVGKGKITKITKSMRTPF